MRSTAWQATARFTALHALLPPWALSGPWGRQARGRSVAIRRGGVINAPAVIAMFKYIIANNRAGGWRKLKRAR